MRALVLLLFLSCLACAGLARRAQIARVRGPVSLTPSRRQARAHAPKKSLATLLSKINAALESQPGPSEHTHDLEESTDPFFAEHGTTTPRSLEKFVLRVRGGAQNDDPVEAALNAKTQTGKMSRDEILQKLNRVPVFCIAQGNGSVLEVGECCTWYLDAGEAQVAFTSALAANPLSGLHLQVHELGKVFTECNGWPRKEVSEDPGHGILKLQAPKALLQHCDAQLAESLRKQGLDPGSWRVPVFIGEALAQAGPNGEQLALPIFFSPQDLQQAYMMAKVPQSEMERGMSVMDIRQILARMEEEPVDFPNPWRAVQFVTTPSAIKLATDLAQKR
mmetsp:Transcript_80613/g.146997  ORF Transcript_80613/g.146997 Transcript_80613/m.146997 type:complete len:334 (+) Transcript_80613:72-1073(+)